MKILVSGSTKTVARLAHDWQECMGVLLTPANGNSVESILKTRLDWAADNGCFNGLNEKSFVLMLNKIQGSPRLKWVACPDKVADADETLRMFDRFEPLLRSKGFPVAFVAQDGQDIVSVPWEKIEAIFIGGSTKFKLSEAAGDIAREAKVRGKWLHIGRVNTMRRLITA